jgi:hypothetical protein
VSKHAERSIALADKVRVRAENAVSSLALEMVGMRWPAEFRAIVWEAVALVASSRAKEARRLEQREKGK